MIERYRRWFEYEKDSHEKTLASLDAVAEELRQSPEFRKAVYLMWHIVAARRMWLFRMGVVKENVELFPDETDFVALPAQVAEMETLWTRYLSGLTDDDLARVFKYQSYEGPHFTNTVEDIVTQMFGHSWYHRGQIALLLRSMGAEPAVTDLVFWTRAPVGP